MAETKKSRKIVWAIDPFEKQDETRKSVLGFLRLLAGRYNARIEPVYVFSPESFNLSLEFSSAWNKQYGPDLRKALDFALGGVDVPGMGPPQILWQKRASQRSAIQKLLSHATASGADLIVTGTHGRAGLQRLVLGSFAETLLLQSRIPVLVIRPGWQPRSIERILFPTDFGAGSKKVFDRVVEIARAWNAELILHHAIPRAVEPVFQSGVYLMGGGWIPFAEFLSAEEDRSREIMKDWEAHARKSGARIHSILDTSSVSVTESILGHAQKESVSLIALEARSGAAKSALLGSISRQVVRSASSLVWVLRQ